MGRLLLNTLILTAAVILAGVSALAQNNDPKPPKELDDKNNPLLVGKRDINKGQLAFYSLDREVALGRQMAGEVDRSSRVITDPLVTEYVNRVAQNIVLHSDAKVPFTIKVLDSNDVNAFALPGGFLYVNRGLLEAADNEAEVAGVLAHEIAHVTARHGIEQASKGELLQYASIPLIFFGGLGGYILQQAAGLAVPLTFLKFSRSAEQEADRLGAQYLWAAGYDPNALVTFFEKLQGQEKRKPGTLAKVFSTHPMTSDRIKEVQGLVARFPEKNEYQLSTSEFNGVKSRLMAASAASRSTYGANPGDDRRPTLKRRPTTQTDDSSTESPDSIDSDRPVLKRRDSVPESSGAVGGQTTSSSSDSPSDASSDSGRPVLKRKDGSTATGASGQTGNSSPSSEKPAETTGRPTLKRRTDPQ